MSLFAERLREELIYDRETGVFRRKISRSNRVRVGDVAGTDNGEGHLSFSFEGKLYLAHRLAWVYVHGDFPKGEIDHIDQNKANNAIANLRDVDRQTNRQNISPSQSDSKTGVRGVCFDPVTRKFKAQITYAGRRRGLGYFETMEEASAAYEEARRTFHPGYAGA